MGRCLPLLPLVFRHLEKNHACWRDQLHHIDGPSTVHISWFWPGKHRIYIYIYTSTLTFSAAVWFLFCRDLFPCHCNFFSCCMYKCRYFCIVRVEPQKGVTRSSESWDTTYCGPCLPIFKNISYNGKLQNLQKSSSWARIKYDGNFALNFAVWQQPLRFFKAEM